MGKKKPEPILLNEISAEDLGVVAEGLNGQNGPAVQSQLLRLLDAWRVSGPNLNKMMRNDAGLWNRVQNSWKMLWLPTTSGNAQIALFPVNRKKPTAADVALALFYSLTLNPECTKLAGPCSGCGKYYVMNTVRQNKYCTRRCGSLTTAVAATRRRLQKNHADKLGRAKEALRLLAVSRTSLDWKQWVSRKEPDITPKWLTRAVNRGDLRPFGGVRMRARPGDLLRKAGAGSKVT